MERYSKALQNYVPIGEVHKRFGFNVLAPQVTFDTKTNSVHVWNNYNPPPKKDGSPGDGAGQDVVQFGNWHNQTTATVVPGITFKATVKVDPPGDFQWVQVVDYERYRWTAQSGTVVGSTRTEMLDTGYPYPNKPDPNNPNVWSTEDSPGNQLSSTFRRFEVSKNFSMYFEFIPLVPGRDAIWVPVAKVPWSFSADTSWNAALGKWELTAGANSVNPAAQYYPGPPDWDSNIATPPVAKPE